MAAILYKLADGEVIEERVMATDVHNLLDSGYFASPELAKADTNESGKLSNDEIRQAAKDAGIPKWDTARIDTLKKKLANEQD
jgi:hypothetical protein